jgi:hypothetical protein
MIVCSFSFLSFPSWASGSPPSQEWFAVVRLPVFLFFVVFFPVFPVFFFKHHYISPPVEVSMKERPHKNQIRFTRPKKGVKNDFFGI